MLGSFLMKKSSEFWQIFFSDYNWTWVYIFLYHCNMVINNQEENFSSKIEEFIEWDWRKIKELGSNNWWKSYQFQMNDDTDKILTPDDVKNIIKDNYHFWVESIILKREDNTKFDSWTCKAGDIIRVYVNLLIEENTEIITQTDTVNIYKFDNVHISDDVELDDETSNEIDITNTEIWDNIENTKHESPYKKMIENQTWKICYGNRNKPELTLTIDDGNSYDDVKAILDILKEENIKTTFFVKWNRLNYKKNGKDLKDLRKRAIDEWHQICCHTYSHIYLCDTSDVTKLPYSWENSFDKRSNNVKRLLWEKYYNELEMSERKKWINFPKTVSSDVLLETEILMREAEIKNILWEEEWTNYLQEYKRDYPFIRLPWWNGLKREKNVALLRRLWFLSIYWSDDFLHKKNSKGERPHYTIDEMRVQNWWIPLFHFKWKNEQEYIKQYISKAKSMGKTFKPITDIIEPK